MNDKYIIYEHIFPNGKRYIGITCRRPKERWKNGYGYAHNQYMKNAIKKYGWDNVQHNILYTNLSKEVAEKEEIRLIALYKLTDRRFGYNIDEGGTTTKRISEETRCKLRQKCSGKNNARYGVEVTKETRDKMRKAKLGKKQPESQKIKRRITLGKPIAQYTLDGQYIKTFSGGRQVKRELGIHNASACARGECRTSGGYIWKYV